MTLSLNCQRIEPFCRFWVQERKQVHIAEVRKKAQHPVVDREVCLYFKNVRMGGKLKNFQTWHQTGQMFRILDIYLFEGKNLRLILIHKNLFRHSKCSLAE